MNTNQERQDFDYTDTNTYIPTMFDLQKYIDFGKLFIEKELNKKYAEEKHIRVIVHKNKALLRYIKEYLNKDNIKTLGLFRSVIYDIENNKIICFSPPKSHCYEDFVGTVMNTQDLQTMNFVEGTMINMFWDPTTNDIEISTKSNIGANCYFSIDKNKQSFRDMMFDAFEKHTLDFKEKYFNKHTSQYEVDSIWKPPKNMCFSMVLQHPQNRIVTKFEKKSIHLIAVYEMDGFTVKPRYDLIKKYNQDNNIIYDNIYSETHAKETHLLQTNKLYDYYELLDFKEKYELEAKSQDKISMGVVLYAKETGFHTKIRNPTYEYIRQLKGNNIKPQYRFYELKKASDPDTLISEYLMYFPEHTVLFECYENDFIDNINKLYNMYVKCFIKHEIKLKDTPYNFKPHLYNIHGMYLNDVKEHGVASSSITKNNVTEYIIQLEIPKILHFMNYNLKKNMGYYDNSIPQVTET